MKLEGKILPHIIQKLKEDTYNLDIEVITASPDGVAKLCAKGSTGFRFVVSLADRTCSCSVWRGSGIPCKHAIAYITSIPRAKLEDFVDDYFSVSKFKAAYEGSFPCIPDKSMWPKASHGFVLNPPLLRSTGGRRKNRMKSSMERGSSQKRAKKHKCPICQELGHHWYTCKNGNLEDIAAMEKDKGVPKREPKKHQAATQRLLLWFLLHPSQPKWFSHIMLLLPMLFTRRERGILPTIRARRQLPALLHQARAQLTGLGLVQMNLCPSKLCTWPHFMKTPLPQWRQSHCNVCCPPSLHQGSR